MKIIIESIHFTADEKLIRYIENKLDKVEGVFDRIVETRVILKLENSGQVKDKIIELILLVPGGRPLVATASEKTFEKATNQAIQNLRRQVKRHKEKLRSKSR